MPRLLVVAVVMTSLHAQAASPRLTNILPRGAARGETVEVRLLGERLGDAVDVLFHDPGIALEEIIEKTPGQVRCRLSIAPDCRLGRHGMRVRTSSGLSDLRIFSVGALHEIQETEPNSTLEQATPIALGTTINGVIASEDVDYFAVELEEGARLAVEVEAIRLGHVLFDAKLRLFSPQGVELVSEDDTALLRQDAAFVRIAQEAGRHVIAVSEASYGGSGDYEYRLHVGTFPRPLAVTPMGGRPGETVTVHWLGDSAMETSEIVLAANQQGTVSITPALGESFAPTPMPFRATDLATALELEPNDAREQATPGVAPGAFDGVIAAAGDADWYAFDGHKGQVFRVRVWARALGSPIDSVLNVYKPDGSELAGNDDAAGLDSSVRVTLPVDGRYTLRIHDHLGHGGPTFAYRVEVSPVKPRVHVRVAEMDDPRLSVPRGNRTLLLLAADRSGFDGPLELAFNNLPQGVTVEHGPFPQGATRLPVVVTASPDASATGALTDIQVTWTNGDQVVAGGFKQRIPLVLGRNKTEFDEQDVDRLALAVTEEAPFSIEVVPPRAPLMRNSMFEVKLIAHRREGFDAPIQVKAPWLPKGFGMPAVSFGKGQSERLIRVEARREAPLGVANLVLVGTSANYRVCTPFFPVTIEEPWITLAIAETQAEQGTELVWPATLTVSKPFEGTIQLEMYRFPKGVTSESQPVTADAASITFPVHIAAEAPVGKHGPVGVRTTLTINGEKINLGLSGAHLKVFAPLPPQLKTPPPAPTPTVAKKAPDAPKRRTRFPTQAGGD